MTINIVVHHVHHVAEHNTIRLPRRTAAVIIVPSTIYTTNYSANSGAPARRTLSTAIKKGTDAA